MRCTIRGVARLGVVGSAARSDARSEVRDVDLLARFVPMPPTELAHVCFGLLDDLRSIVSMPVCVDCRDTAAPERAPS